MRLQLPALLLLLLFERLLMLPVLHSIYMASPKFILAVQLLAQSTNSSLLPAEAATRMNNSIFWAPHIFLFSFSVSKVNMMLMTSISSCEPSTVLRAWYVLAPFNTMYFKLCFTSPVFKMRKLRLKKRWITCSGSCSQVSCRTGLKSRTVYYKAHFSQQSVGRSCFNSMVLQISALPLGACLAPDWTLPIR